VRRSRTRGNRSSRFRHDFGRLRGRRRLDLGLRLLTLRRRLGLNLSRSRDLGLRQRELAWILIPVALATLGHPVDDVAPKVPIVRRATCTSPSSLETIKISEEVKPIADQLTSLAPTYSDAEKFGF
jgi:hypothetical protein